MKLFKIFCKEEDTKVLIESESDKEALKEYKKQVAYKPGVSKSDYYVKEYK